MGRMRVNDSFQAEDIILTFYATGERGSKHWIGFNTALKT